MLEPALFRHDRVPGDVLHWTLNRRALKIRQPHAIGSDYRDVAIRQKHHVARVMQHRRNIARHEVFVLAQANHRGRSQARRHDFVRVARRNHRQRVDARQLLHCFLHRAFERAIEVLFNQVRDHFRIRLGQKLVPFLNQLLLQFQIILDNPVVHHHDFAFAVAVRMRILFRRTPVRGPARVPDSVESVERAQTYRLFQIPQFPRCPPDIQLAVLRDHGDSCRVISAIFQPLQAVKNQRHHFFRPYVPHDSAHKVLSLAFCSCCASAPKPVLAIRSG